MTVPEPPDGTRLEFAADTDLYAAWRDDEASREADWPTGDGGKVWCLYGWSVPRTWQEMIDMFGADNLRKAVRLIPDNPAGGAVAAAAADSDDPSLYALHATAPDGWTTAIGPINIGDALLLIDQHLTPHRWTTRFVRLEPVADATRRLTTTPPQIPAPEADFYVHLRRAIICHPDNDGADSHRTQALIAHAETHRARWLYTGDQECLLAECGHGSSCPTVTPVEPYCAACSVIVDTGSEYGPEIPAECRIGWPCPPLAKLAAHYRVSVGEADAAQLVDAIREELVQLWGDMSWAVRTARRGCWSGQCENLADRIARLSRLAGPTPWRDIEVELLRSGVYERVYRDAGIQHPPVDHAEVERLHQYLQGQEAV